MSGILEALRIYIQNLSYDGVLPETFQYGFVINSLICGILIGPLLGWMGTMILIKRMAFFSQAIGNAALTGVAIGILVGEPYNAPYISMFGFCLLFGIVLKFTQYRTSMSLDTLIGVFLSISLALGASLILFVSARVNTHILESILFGSILTVNDTDIMVLVVVGLICVGVGLPLFNRTLLASFDPGLAHARGLAVRRLDYIFVVLITILTVACVKIVGAVLVVALLLIPAASARNISASISGFVGWSVVFSSASCLLGIVVPMQYDLAIPSGGAIVLAAGVIFVITTIIRSTFGRFKEAGV
ncbi:MAG: metal ABC transporter permease [Micropepsaceae bacterium]